MPVACLRSFNLSLSKTSFNLRYGYHHFINSTTQITISKAHLSKLSLDDYELLRCLTRRKLQQTRDLIDKIRERTSQSRIITWTSLLSRFSKNGYIDESRLLFDIMPSRNIVTYNAMLSAYVQCGMVDDARRFFEEMPERNVVSWTSMLCGFANSGRIEEALRVFYLMPERNVVSWNSMVVGLIRNGDLREARRVFDLMPERNVVSWNAMIEGYVENGRMNEARSLFDKMEEHNVVTWTSLVSGYCRVGNVEEGYYLFCRMPDRNIVSWTAMIGGFAWNGFYKEAFLLFLEMRKNHDIKLSIETIISLAYSCAGIGFPCLGKQLHAHVIVNSWAYDDYDRRLYESLIHMYSTCGIMDFASYLFLRNWKNCTTKCCNSMISGYILTGQLEEARIVFENMPCPDKISCTAMINGYFNFGQVARACQTFNDMPNRDSVAWTTMISGYVQNELLDEAMQLFEEMRVQGFQPMNSTYSTLLGAAGAMANLDQGRQLHGLISKAQGDFDLILENSLISMYAKCGEINDAYRIFLRMTSRDLISWNSMIIGFSYHGLVNEALALFSALQEVRIQPNAVTFLGVLSACSHAGLIEEGCKLFESMRDTFAVEPEMQHYICMIDLLGRAGKVEEAEKFVLELPFEPGVAIWGALLGVCGFGKTRAEIAKRTAKRLLELDPSNAPAQVLLRNISSATGQYHEEGMLREEMNLKRVRKVPGCSWISLEGQVHQFLSRR